MSSSLHRINTYTRNMMMMSCNFLLFCFFGGFVFFKTKRMMNCVFVKLSSLQGDINTKSWSKSCKNTWRKGNKQIREELKQEKKQRKWQWVLQQRCVLHSSYKLHLSNFLWIVIVLCVAIVPCVATTLHIVALAL